MMRFDELRVGMRVQDGHKRGFVSALYRRTAHVRWSSHDKSDKWVYDRAHVQFLTPLTLKGSPA